MPNFGTLSWELKISSIPRASHICTAFFPYIFFPFFFSLISKLCLISKLGLFDPISHFESDTPFVFCCHAVRRHRSCRAHGSETLALTQTNNALSVLISLEWSWWGISFNICRGHLGLQYSFTKVISALDRYFLVIIPSTVPASRVTALVECHFIEVLLTDSGHIHAMDCQINITINEQILPHVHIRELAVTEDYQCKQTVKQPDRGSVLQSASLAAGAPHLWWSSRRVCPWWAASHFCRHRAETGRRQAWWPARICCATVATSLNFQPVVTNVHPPYLCEASPMSFACPRCVCACSWSIQRPSYPDVTLLMWEIRKFMYLSILRRSSAFVLA